MGVRRVPGRRSVELGDLVVRDLGARYVLTEPLRVQVDGFEIIVPAGFDTDFSSVPRVLSGFIDFRQIDLAGVVHDYLYRYAPLPRARADRIWRLLAVAGSNPAPAWRARVAHRMLRVGGWHAWRQQPYSGAYRQNGKPRGEP